MVFFGFVAVCGTVFVNLGLVPELAVWAAVPPGALATAILVVNNVRDRETDVLAGKRTLAVRFGRAAGIAEYRLLIVAAFLTPMLLFMTGKAGLADPGAAATRRPPPCCSVASSVAPAASSIRCWSAPRSCWFFRRPFHPGPFLQPALSAPADEPMKVVGGQLLRVAGASPRPATAGSPGRSAPACCSS